MGRRKNPNVICIPNIRYYEVKNPPSLFPINWEEKYGEDRVRYEMEPIYDKDGNYLETKENVYVVMEEVIGYRFMKRKLTAEEQKEKSKIKPRKLFETYSDIKRKEEEENERKKIESGDLL